MAQSFERSDQTTSFYGSGAVIAEILLKNRQIQAAPDFADTYDASFVNQLTQ
jgi:NitT/TauT family transport system substrate-binding protein